MGEPTTYFKSDNMRTIFDIAFKNINTFRAQTNAT